MKLGKAACLMAMAVWMSHCNAEGGAGGVESGDDYSGVFSGLPWAFLQTTGRTGEASQTQNEVPPARSSRVFGFETKDPVSRNSNGEVYLRLELAVLEFEDSKDAVRHVRSTVAAADPDMGLSYAWDYLLASGGQAYHLHAGCIASEAHFMTMAANLRTLVSDDVGSATDDYLCRCGGGCRIGNWFEEALER